MIFTDGSRLVSNQSLDELHLFARLIGLNPEWFKNDPDHPHYQILSTKKKELIFNKGAIFVSAKEIIGICNNLQKAVNSGKNKL